MRRVPWTRQPPYPCGIDWSNPITRNLVFAFEGANGQRCPISRLSAPLSSGNTRDVGRYGIQQKFSGSQAGGSNNFGALTAISGATQATWDVLFYLDNVSQSAKVFQQWNNNNQNWLIETSGTGLLWVALDDDSGQRRRWDATNTFPTAGWYRLILVWTGGSSKRARINKVDITASLTEVNNTGTAHGNNLDPLSIGVAIDSPLAGKVVFARMWTRALSVAEVVSLEDLSWQIFEPYTVFGMSPTYVTAQFLRPISDISNSGWTPSSGSDLFAMIGEATRNDATYISATEVGAACEVLLGTSTGDPLSSVNHLPRIVMSAGSGGIIIRLKQGTTLIKEWTYASLTGTDTLYEPTLSSGEIDSITDYTNLRLYMETTE